MTYAWKTDIIFLYYSAVTELVSEADRLCRKRSVDLSNVSNSNIRGIPLTDIIDTIQQYDGVKEPLVASETNIHRIGEAIYKNNRYNIIHTSYIYPEHWCPPPIFTRSPYFIHRNDQSEKALKDWYEPALGSCLSAPWLKQKLWMTRSAENGAFAQPYAANNHVELLGQLFCALTIGDDYFIEEEASKSKSMTSEQILLVFGKPWKLACQRRNGYQKTSQLLTAEIRDLALKNNDTVLEPSLYLMFSIADNYVRLGADEAWCNRMYDATEKWIVVQVEEATGYRHRKKALALRDSSKNVPVTLTSRDHLPFPSATTVTNDMTLLEILVKQRMTHNALEVFALAVEQSCGINLRSVDSLLGPLFDILGLLTGCVNDIFSVGKDLEGHSNIALGYHHIYQCSLQQSIDFEVTLHGLLIKKFDEMAEGILQLIESDCLKHHVSIYIEQLRLLARGYSQWHNSAERYTTLASDETNKQIFLCSVADGNNQRFNALMYKLQQFKQLAMNK